MANYLSPGVYSLENNVSATVQNTVINYSAHVIRCPKKGPELKKMLITSEENLIMTFGEPTNVKQNYIDILSAQGALLGTSTLNVVAIRPSDATFAGARSTTNISTSGSNDTETPSLSGNDNSLQNTSYITFSPLETSGENSLTLNDFVSKDPDEYANEFETNNVLDVIHYSRGSLGNRYRFAIINKEIYTKAKLKEEKLDNEWYSALMNLSGFYLDTDYQFLVMIQELPESSEDLEKNWKLHSYFVVSCNDKEIDSESQSSLFIENVLNQKSILRVTLNQYLKNKSWNYATEGWVRLDGGFDGTVENITDGDIIQAFDLFKSIDEIDLSFFISAGKSEAVVKSLESLSKNRYDCIVLADVPEETVLNNKGYETTAILAWRKGLAPYNETENMNISSDRIALFANWIEVYDKWNKKYRWIPCSGYVAGVFAYSDNVSEAWYAAAGLNRGVIGGSIRRLAYNPSKSERDLLYVEGINAIVSFTSSGKVVWGNKTLLNSTSSFSSINVRRLFDYIEKNTLESLKVYLFEPNDEYTRSQIVTAIEPFLRDIQARRGIYEYKVICDSTNNTAQRIDAKELWVDVMIKPTRSAEFIIVRFTNTSYGSSFDEIAANLGM